ncbi:MAG TPA: hypothetical protein VGG60_01790 [Candidatus Binataceae bacterium]|jgi:hypothetical protein
MKVFENVQTLKEPTGAIFLLMAIVFLNGCSALPLGTNQSQLATENQELGKLKSAEYQDYTSAMSFEDSNQKLGNYYTGKGAQVHYLIDRMEEGQPVKDAEIAKALDTSAAEKYDDRPPVPLDDEVGNGY